MMDDFGAFFVSVAVLDKKEKVKYLFRDKLEIPIANGWQILGEKDEEFELVTIHTVKEIFPQITDYVDKDYGTKLEVVYDGENFVNCVKIK